MKITREEITVEILELLYDFQYVLEHQNQIFILMIPQSSCFLNR